MPVEAFGGQGFVSTEELLRSDLARVLHEAAAAEQVRHWFAETVQALEQTPTGVLATFREHDVEVFDVVVGADGAHSRVRLLAFGPEEQFRRPLGLAHAWFTLTETPSTPGLDGWYLVHNASGSLVVEARPGHPGEQQVGLTFPADTLPPRRDREGRLALLDRTFAGCGWRTGEILAAARTAPDFALDTFDQIQLLQWHRGRIVLLGDSAWCASPLSGLGTALALHGAAALAVALRTEDTPIHESLTNYQQHMRPRVEAAQRMFPGRVRSFAPRTTVGILAVVRALQLVQTPFVARIIDRKIPSNAG